MWNPEIPSDSKLFGSAPTQAVVIDVITNEEHGQYGPSGFNVGTIRFKYLDYGGHRDTILEAFYAFPLEVAVQEYPLIGEIVTIQKIKGIHFYSRRINVNKRLQYNSFPNILNQLNVAKQRQDHDAEVEKARVYGQTVRSSDEHGENFKNENYQARESLHNLKHFLMFLKTFIKTLRVSENR